MGLFSFLKSAGAKLMGTKAATNDLKAAAEVEAAEDRKETMLEAVVRSMGLGVDDLSVDVEGDTVTVFGQTESQADREKVILTLGNIEGVATVDDRISVVPPKDVSVFYEVKGGDSLSKIAKAHYGDPMKYMKIFEANKPMLKDPSLIYPGQMLRIPQD